MVSDSMQKIISEFFIPDELKDDIAYCQRSLRDYVKVHQHFAQQCNDLSAAQQSQVKGFLRELEDEMLAIGKDQSGLVQDLTKRLKLFQRKTATERSVELEDDYANGYVAWVLSTHCELQNAPSYVPRAVSERLNETQLYQKYRIGRDMARPDKQRSKRPVLQTTLQKPRAERTGDSAVRSQSKPSVTPPSTPSSLPPPPPAVVKIGPATIGSKRKVPSELQMPAKMLRSRTSSMILVKQEPAPIKQEPLEEPSNDSEESSPSSAIGIQVSPGVKRGRCNLRQALNKVKNTQKVDAPVSNSKLSTVRSSRPATSLPCTPPTGQCSPSLSSSESSNSRASTPGTPSNANATGCVRKQEVTSDDSSNERFLPLHEEIPPQPCNIDELDQYSFLKQFGLYTIEDSNMLKGRKNERKRRSCYSTERKDFHYGRLDYFEQQLYIMRRQGSNKRVRLLYSATTAEKANKKRKPWSNVGTAPPPPLLPSTLLPPSASKPTTADISNASPCEPLASASFTQTIGDTPMDPENKVCFVCNKAGPMDPTSACTKCCNIYHLSCHVEANGSEDEKDEKQTDSKFTTPQIEKLDEDDHGDENQNRATVQLLPQRENLCPICFALAKGSKHKK